MNPETRPTYAHTLDERPESEWQDLEEHLRAVAELAAGFAEPFGAAAWGRLAGLWHDLGKYRPRFQDYLRGRESTGGDHSVVGALLAQERFGGRAALPLALVIAGHHAGLANPATGAKPRALGERLKERKPDLEEVLPHVAEALLAEAQPALPERLVTRPRNRLEKEALGRRFELWTRFLFSALVDADYLDTEAFYRPEERAAELVGREGIAELRARLDAHVDALAAGAKASEVNRVRAEVLAACRAAAGIEPGLFSLAVPTGGGKTLAAMAFALRHAERHGLRRVIAVIPFTSILEQNAFVYRQALGDANVLEHHSNVDPEKESRRNKLASENWDAPVVVTTGVQFFESLFANRTSRCRKLHNVAGSVILLDEAQTLPIKYQKAILEVLQELARGFGCSVVLSTATQPAFEQREDFPHGLENVREIAPDPRALAQRLRRFEVVWPQADEAVSWPELAAEIAEERQALVVVHRRKDASDLMTLLPEAGRYHLSAAMCAAHRLAKLGEIRQALHDGEVCRLVSTQLIEAGVDVDFPLVYRALGGLDSLVQAGGRANREGRLEMGKLVVFRAPTKPPRGTPQLGLETTRELLARYGAELDPTDPEHVATYFRLLFSKESPDAEGLQAERAQLNFATVAERFRLIDDDYSRPLVVPYGLSGERLTRFREEGPSRERLRALQPFLVNVAKWQLDRLVADGAVELVHELIYVLNTGYQHLYDLELGLRLEEAPLADPSALVV